MITVKELQGHETFMHTRTKELYTVEDANAQIKDANLDLWIPCVIYKKKGTDYYNTQRFIRDVPDFINSFSLPEEEPTANAG